MNRKHQEILRRIGQLLSDGIGSSEGLAEELDKLLATGYDLFLVLEPSEAANPQGETLRERVVSPKGTRRPGKFRISGSDLEFFRRIGIDPVSKVSHRETD